MIAALSVWGHGAAALLFALFGLHVARTGRRMQDGMLVAACITTSLWGVSAALDGPLSAFAFHAESLRNLGWLSFMYLLLRRGEGARRTWSLSAIYAALALIIAGQSLWALVPQAGASMLLAGFVMRMIFAVGALLLVHNLYTAAASSARAGIGLPMAALTAMWAYDLNLYTLSYLGGQWVDTLAAWRGMLVAALAPVIALAARRNANWAIRLSRTVAFRSLSLVAAACYLLGVFGISAMMKGIGAHEASIVQAVFLTAAAGTAVVVLPSPRARAWTRVMLSKHLFAHRYDYRAEWLRFTETLGRPGDVPAPLDVRVVKAIADITESPGGVLLVPEDSGLVPRGVWNWESLSVPTFIAGDELIALLTEGRIVELDTLRGGDGRAEASAVPAWMLNQAQIWALVPLVHFDRLTGAVLLERPVLARTLDWEDFDLLRVAGRQVASYLAEARGQEVLSDVQRFDEFNRRFAFIMHDIKNLVSQLTLVTRNAERHADKPEFQADMIATLQSSTARMNDLLARLSQHNKARAEAPRAIPVVPLVAELAAAKRTQHPVIVMGCPPHYAIADAAGLEAALAHLVQNAIDASPEAEPVTLNVMESGDETGIEVIDAGTGMSAEFIRSQLFRPFASTKEGGFGVGAHEARTLVAAMGGRIAVESEVGRGSRFTIWLPAARDLQETMVA